MREITLTIRIESAKLMISPTLPNSLAIVIGITRQIPNSCCQTPEASTHQNGFEYDQYILFYKITISHEEQSPRKAIQKIQLL